jgi:hypothetical protein
MNDFLEGENRTRQLTSVTNLLLAGTLACGVGANTGAGAVFRPIQIHLPKSSEFENVSHVSSAFQSEVRREVVSGIEHELDSPDFISPLVEALASRGYTRRNRWS